MQSLARVHVRRISIDDHDVLCAQVGQLDASPLDDLRHIEWFAIELD